VSCKGNKKIRYSNASVSILLSTFIPRLKRISPECGLKFISNCGEWGRIYSLAIPVSSSILSVSWAEPMCFVKLINQPFIFCSEKVEKSGAEWVTTLSGIHGLNKSIIF